jgi:hypothetical protein
MIDNGSLCDDLKNSARRQPKTSTGQREREREKSRHHHGTTKQPPTHTSVNTHMLQAGSGGRRRGWGARARRARPSLDRSNRDGGRVLSLALLFAETALFNKYTHTHTETETERASTHRQSHHHQPPTRSTDDDDDDNAGER